MPVQSKWKGIIGKGFPVIEFEAYCRELQWVTWRPSLIVLLNTANPGLAQRPEGFSSRNMKDLEHYYRNIKKWSSGPHLFIDDRKIWVFTDLTTPGTHSPSWNGKSIGIEMLGNFEKESFVKGRGLKVRKNTVSAIAILFQVMRIKVGGIKLHHEDPLTTHKCPGRYVKKYEIINEVQEWLDNPDYR